MKIVKFGGSFLTDKTAERGVINQENLERLLQIVNELGEAILVFGAGSFGHGYAQAAGLQTDAFIEADVAELEASLEELKKQIFAKLPFDSKVHFAGLQKKDNKVRIVSGDEIVLKLANKYQPKEIIFYGDIAGVHAGNKIYKEFSTTELPQIIEQLLDVPSKKIDVTGQMRGKLIQLSKLKSPTIIKFET